MTYAADTTLETTTLPSGDRQPSPIIGALIFEAA